MQRVRGNLAREGLLARNTVLNLIGQAIPLLIGVVTIPFIVRGLGTERFGLLSLAWVILGYFAIFDLGLGRATTRYVAEAIGKRKYDQVSRLIWTAVVVQASLGLLGSLVLAATIPILIDHVLNIPLELVDEAKSILYSMAVAIPIVLCSGSFSGALQAAQRFDLMNLVRIFSGSLNFLIPCIGIFLGLSLPIIMNLILVEKMIILVFIISLSLFAIPETRKPSFSPTAFSTLFSFGKWVTISSIVNPIILYIDRFLIVSFFPIAALSYYSAPYDAVTRLWVIPSSLVMTLFPVFSSLDRIRDTQRIGSFLDRYMKYVLLTLGPIVIVLMVFARQMLGLWLGIEFSVESASALRILALGVLINSLAQFPFSLLQGIGRPDLPAKFHLLELPFSFAIAWFLIRNWGISGAAAAWTIRVALDAVLLFAACFKLCHISWRLFVAENLLLTYGILLFFTVIASILYIMLNIVQISIFSIISAFCVLCFVWAVWRKVLDTSDKGIILKMIKPWQD